MENETSFFKMTTTYARRLRALWDSDPERYGRDEELSSGYPIVDFSLDVLYPTLENVYDPRLGCIRITTLVVIALASLVVVSWATGWQIYVHV